jgi:hypothetical protein
MEMRNFLSSLFIFSQPNATKYQDKYAHHTESSEPNADIFHIYYEKINCTLTRSCCHNHGKEWMEEQFHVTNIVAT